MLSYWHTPLHERGSSIRIHSSQPGEEKIGSSFSCLSTCCFSSKTGSGLCSLSSDDISLCEEVIPGQVDRRPMSTTHCHVRFKHGHRFLRFLSQVPRISSLATWSLLHLSFISCRPGAGDALNQPTTISGLRLFVFLTCRVTLLRWYSI